MENEQPAGLWGRFVDFVRGPLERVNGESLAWQQDNSGRWDTKTIIVLVTAAVALTIQEYAFGSAGLDRVIRFLNWVGATGIGGWLESTLKTRENDEIGYLTFWIIGQMIVYVVIPAMVIRFVLGEKPTDYGVNTPTPLAGWYLYLGMFLFMFPGLFLFSMKGSFQETYPFYRLLPGESFWPRFIMWELMYAAQFVALEYFFRGFLLHGTKHRFGGGAILVMMVPYCMLHFGKPMTETCGAIVAGIVLGFMSLKTRSIWLGACIHIAVAWSMDALSLWRQM